MKQIKLTGLLLIGLLTGLHGLSQSASTCEGESISFTAPSSVEWQWQKRVTVDWQDVVDAGAYQGSQTQILSISPVALDMNGDSLRCLIPSVLTGELDSVAVAEELIVYPFIEPSIIGFDPEPQLPICYGSNAPLIVQNVVPSGGEEEFEQIWQIFENNEWNDIAGSPDQIDLGVLTGSVSVRQQIANLSGICSVVYSNVLEIPVYEEIQSAVIAIQDGNTGICYNTSPADLIMIEQPTGGSETWSYQWEFWDGVSWEMIEGANNPTLSPSAMTTSGQFRLLTIDSSCGTVTSNILEITVFEELSDTISININGDQSLCSDNDGSSFDLADVPVGGGNQFTYQWFQNNSPLLDETSTSLETGPLSASASFYLMATSVEGCGTIVSSSVEITVFEELNAGEVSASQTICFDSMPDDLTADPTSGGSSTFSYQWQINDGGNWIDLIDQESLVLTLGSLTSSSSFRIISTDEFGCGNTISEVIDIEVLTLITPPDIDFVDYDGTPLCYQDLAPEVFVVSPPTGADGIWSSSWQEEDPEGNWNVVQEGLGNYSSSILLDTVTIRLESTSDFGCGTFYSNVLLIPVWEEVFPGTVGSDQTICYNSDAETLIAEPALGGGGAFDLQWYSDATGLFEPVAGGNNIELDPGVLDESASYFIEYTNTNGCGVLQSMTIEIEVLPELIPAEIAGWDGLALCDGDLITLFGSGIEDYSWLSQQWFYQTNGEQFQELEGYNELMLSGLSLNENTAFYLETTSDFDCGTVVSDTVDVSVLDQLSPPMISFDGEFGGETICYLDDASLITTSEYASGGGGPLSYEWEYDYGNVGEFIGTGNTDADQYAYGSLDNIVSIRLSVTDQYGCGTLVSNVLEQNVYGPLEISQEPVDQLVCFGTSLEGLISMASGGGDVYSYQWYLSEDGITYEAITGQDSEVLETMTLEVESWFYIEITSLEGCGIVNSDSIFVELLPELQEGAIEFAFNPICAQESASINSTQPTGGNNDFDITWFQSSGTDWVQTQVSDLTFISEPLFENAQFFVQYSDLCGTVYSDTLEITVNPTPEINSIQGELVPCQLSTDQLYTIPWANQSYDYLWNVDPQYGVITSGETVSEILVDWYDNSGNTNISVTVTNPLTTCSDTFFQDVEVSDTQAPPASLVIKKPNINILVSADSTDCAQYQWGTENIETGEIEYFSGLTEQYAYFENLDTLNFYYFVEVVYDCGDGPSCPTINYYNYDPFIGIEFFENNEVRIYPNPTTSILTIESGTIQYIELFNVRGDLLLMRGFDTVTGKVTIDLSDLPAGVYFLSLFSTNKTREVHKILKL
jgi:hypothetical protein